MSRPHRKCQTYNPFDAKATEKAISKGDECAPLATPNLVSDDATLGQLRERYVAVCHPRSIIIR